MYVFQRLTVEIINYNIIIHNEKNVKWFAE